jgi:hypothetical protein
MFYRFLVEVAEETPDGRIIIYPLTLQGILPVNHPGRCLDIGCTSKYNHLVPTLSSFGWKVYGVDTREFQFKHPNSQFFPQDVRFMTLSDNFLILVLPCFST